MDQIIFESVRKVFRHRPALFNWLGKERRGEPVAELRPISRKKKVGLPRLTKLWAKLPRLSSDSTDIVSEDRDRCI